MQNYENNQSVEDAINTLKSKDNSADSLDMAARLAEAYGQNNGQASFEGSGNTAFNANGNPDYPDQNIEQGAQVEDPENVAENGDVMDAAAEIAELHAEIGTLNGQLDVMKKQVALEHDKMLRAVAETDNIRKRSEQEIDREKKYALEKFVRSLLPVYDALEKALEFSDRNNEATKATLDGVENTLTLFLKEMSDFGVERIDPQGQPFDPNFHQAISMVPSNDVPENHVLNTMQVGFLLNGRVVRPAMVVVAKAL